MKDKLILLNQSEIEIEEGSSISDIKVILQSKEDIISTWNMFTEENLKIVKIQNNEGIIIGNYKNLLFNSETSATQEDGTILTSFHLREKTEIELLREEINALKEAQEVHDGAISDLGSVVSELSEGGLR